jgi:hypothetical protein
MARLSAGVAAVPISCRGKRWMDSLCSMKGWWCAREDLNLHPLRDQILSLACLPFHHSRKQETILRSAKNKRQADSPKPRDQCLIARTRG